MTKQSTVDKLIEMRLTSMSDGFITQMDDPKMKDVSFEDRFGLLVDIEYNNRKSNSLKRLIKSAGFDQPEAYIADINYTSGRKLNRSLIERLATCEYITEHRNLFITGPPEAVRLTWPVHLAWKPVNSAIGHSTFACRICSSSLI
jgi:ISAfe4, transposase (fragment)